MLTVGILIVLLTSVGVFFLSEQIEQQAMSDLEIKASSHFDQIVITRHWNANYGGIFVKKTGYMESNPYLKELGVEPDIHTIDNTTYTMKNPALMTREISEYTYIDQNLFFHITSLDPVNPVNAPDEFEVRSLEQFENNVRSSYEIFQDNGSYFYRYMEPLNVVPSCVNCHAGYSVGDIRGGISVKFPIDSTYAYVAQQKQNILLYGLILLVLTEGLLYILVRKYITKPLGGLIEGFDRLSSEEFGYQIVAETNDEIGILKSSFNDMSKKLEKSRKVEIENLELQKVNELKDVFIDIMHHDLLGPAGTVQSYADLVFEMESDEKQKKRIKNIRKSAMLLVERIKGAGQLAKLENGTKLELESQNIVKIIESTIQDQQEHLNEMNAEVEFNSSSSVYALVHSTIKEVFDNLLSNAIKYGPENGKVIIKLDDDADHCKISIVDSGDGIPDESKIEIFKRFSRVKKGNIKGSGLGLSIAKKIVDLHEGTIGVEDNPDGKGSVFWVKLKK